MVVLTGRLRIHPVKRAHHRPYLALLHSHLERQRVDLSQCSLVEVRNSETGTASGCENGTYFFTASSPLQIDDNDDPGKTLDTATFGLELDVEPEPGAAGNPATERPASDTGTYAWRGAVTNGSKESGFKITLNKTKELSSEDKSGHTTRRLIVNATIVPGAPEGEKQ